MRQCWRMGKLEPEKRTPCSGGTLRPPWSTACQARKTTVGTPRCRQRTRGARVPDAPVVHPRGVIPRAVHELFNMLAAMRLDGVTQTTVLCSYLQIFNDQLYDLLEDGCARCVLASGHWGAALSTGRFALVIRQRAKAPAAHSRAGRQRRGERVGGGRCGVQVSGHGTQCRAAFPAM